MLLVPSGQVHLPSDDLPLLLHAAFGDEAHHTTSLLDFGEPIDALAAEPETVFWMGGESDRCRC